MLFTANQSDLINLDDHGLQHKVSPAPMQTQSEKKERSLHGNAPFVECLMLGFFSSLPRRLCAR